MTIGAVLAEARARITAAGIDDAALEAEVLLGHALGWEPARLLAHRDEPLPAEAAERFGQFLERRLNHEPTAYILGRREFYGLDIEVTPAVLIPRPETELLVETTIELAKPRSRIRRGPIIADVGTGAGAVAIALALNVPRSEIYAIDISPDALALAEKNARRLGADGRITFLRGDLLSPLMEYVDVVVANLPYVRTCDWLTLPPEIREHEPRLALDGGDNGLDVIRRLLTMAPHYLRPKGAVCLEFGVGQTEALVAAAGASFPSHRIEVRKDLAGLDRVLLIT